MREQAPGANLLYDSVSGASSLVCTGWGTYPGACFGSVLQEQAPSCVLVGVLTRERVTGASSLVCTGWGSYPGACFASVLQEQALSCVLVGVLTRERVSGACFRSKLPRVHRP